MSLFRRLLVVLKAGVGMKFWNQANVYANTIGSIWMTKDGQYGNRNPGTGYLWDVPSSGTGHYANRV